jgi:hypothetical protein
MFDDDITRKEYEKNELKRMMEEYHKHQKKKPIQVPSGWPMPIPKEEEEKESIHPTMVVSSTNGVNELEKILDYITSGASDKNEFYRQVALHLTYQQTRLNETFDYKHQGKFNLVQHLVIYYIKNASSISNADKVQQQIETVLSLLNKLDSKHVSHSLSLNFIDGNKVKRSFLNHTLIFKSGLFAYTLNEETQNKFEKAMNYLLKLAPQKVLVAEDGQYCFKLLEKKNYIVLSYLYNLSSDVELMLENKMSFKNYIQTLKKVDYPFDERLEKIYLDASLSSHKVSAGKLKL